MMVEVDLCPASRTAKTLRARRTAAHHKENPSAIVTLLRGWNDWDRASTVVSRSARSCAILQPNTAAARLAQGALANQLNADGVQCFHQLHQGIDIAADDALARFHALDSGYGETSQFGEATLIKADQGSCRTQLGSGHHVSDITNRVQGVILHS